MTAREKAQAGLWMIEEAIKQIIRETGPMRPGEAEDALSLRWKKPLPVNGICEAIMKKMAKAGHLMKGAGLRPAYSLPVGSTH